LLGDVILAVFRVLKLGEENRRKFGERFCETSVKLQREGGTISFQVHQRGPTQ